MSTRYTVLRYNPVSKRWTVELRTGDISEAYAAYHRLRASNVVASLSSSYVDVDTDDETTETEDEFYNEIRLDR